MTAAWTPAILAVFALLFASSPVTALQTSATPMAMLMAPADTSGSDTPCDPVEMSCVRLCAVLCQGLVPTPGDVVRRVPSADVHHRLPASPLVGLEREAEDPPPRV